MTQKIKNPNTQTKTSLKKVTKYRKTRIVLLVAIIVLLAAISYVVFAINKQTTNQSANTAWQNNTSDLDSKSEELFSENDAANANGESSSVNDAGSGATQAQQFSFSDTSSWVRKNSRDGAFSVKYIQNLTYSACSDLADNLMVGMVLYANSAVACNGLQKAVTVQPYGQGSTVLLTQTIIARSDDSLDRGSAEPISVVLEGGQTAERYAYTSNISGVSYDTVEYVILVNGKRYVALNTVQTGVTPNMSTIDFDTLIQKTLVFND